VAERARERIEPALALVPEDGVPRLVHDDFRPANLLFDASREEPITAVLDWQDVLAAHPEYHLAQTEFLFIDSAFQDPAIRDRLRETLHDGYRKSARSPSTTGNEERRPLYQLSTLLWRMGGFEDAFAEGFRARPARAEAQYRQQFERLVESLPRP